VEDSSKGDTGQPTMLRSTLLYLSKSDRLKQFLTSFKSFNNITRRFVAGEDLDEAVNAIRILNSRSIATSFDHLGESISSEDETREEVHEYLRILDRISETGIDSNVSVKLTQLGLDVSPRLCYLNTLNIVAAAGKLNNFVRIDMEDSSKTDGTIDVFRRLRQDHENVGIVIQAYLYRSEKDLEGILKTGARVRLCKGAYNEPPSAAFRLKQEVDDNFVRLMKLLLTSGIYHGIATHDEKMIQATKAFSAEQGISKAAFEFQMLYGIRRDLQEQLVSEGYRMRVYVPYGKYWYPYFMRRLAERPANLWFVAKNMIKG
jgi:proline dehydrogenase